ncbi:hypothetical protein LLEC1_02740 [Akanthomyces lecanii]|uniref:Zn(2)-C6 fungal-type domain-containing protein n=1 Tax=Cordyceps confragosa TaxID=2714763 RepID=A0A179IH90_CORDF|nr:hypothetical protein LLEC1_02740 [Akanthomyces lecanii]
MKSTSDSTVHARAARPSQRSSTACSRCHERKVRCDITTSGGSCSNCRANQVECVTFQAKKRDADTRVSSEPETIFYGSESQSSKIGDHSNDSGRRGITCFSCPLTFCQPSANAEPVSNEAQPNMDDAGIPSFDARYKLPGYVRTTPSSMAQDDIDHLARKNVFTLPSESLRNSCVTSYIHWVHFFLPLLDLREFLSILAHPDGSCGQVSLLLLYAVMLGGATFTPQSEITKAGYTSRFAARRDFFQRCKSLYYTNYESDRIVIVQALLLMSYWQEKHDESTNHWYWSEVGCLTARAIGLFKDPVATSLPERSKALRRRIGWSCVLRDRVLNLGVRMPVKVKNHELGLPRLSEADFDIASLGPDAENLLPDCHMLRDVALQSRLAKLCIEKTQLCLALEVVFDCLYEESHPKLGTKTEVTLILLPVAERAASVGVASLEDQLQEWPKSLPEELKSGGQDPVVDEKSRIMFLHYSMLNMFYETIMCTFYRPLLLAEQYSTDVPSGRCKQRMAHSTMLITRSFEDLEEHDLVRFLPSSGVTFLLTAATNHLMEFKLMGASQQRHLRRFQDCLSYMKVLKTVHVYAKYADLFLRHVALQVGLNKFSVPAGDINDDKLVEREGLGPWATAHTPDLLVSQLSIPRQAVAAEVSSMAVDVREADDNSASPHSRYLPGSLLPPDGSQDYVRSTMPTNTGAAAGYVLDDSPTCDVDDLIDGSGFLSNTLWEYGWINQVTNIWPEEPWRGGRATDLPPSTS